MGLESEPGQSDAQVSGVSPDARQPFPFLFPQGTEYIHIVQVFVCQKQWATSESHRKFRTLRAPRHRTFEIAGEQWTATETNKWVFMASSVLFTFVFPGLPKAACAW